MIVNKLIKHFENLKNSAMSSARMSETASAARRAAAEGIVMLENKNNTLPLKRNARISVFGRCQIDYNIGGTGSGGMVNTPYTVNILDGLREKEFEVNENLANTYQDWIKNNPVEIDKNVWASQPHCRAELEVTPDVAKSAAEFSDTAIIVIGRTAGEEQDNSDKEGSYRLNNEEHKMLENIRREFKRVIVLLNTSNIIDMSWVSKYGIDAVLYIWQGGQEGGRAAADVLSGDVCPSGRLTDTIAADYTDYPTSKNFGGIHRNYYAEDIYVGYRYFETFAADKVLYPFGYGLSYTDFELKISNTNINQNNIEFDVLVKNVGKASGTEVVQIYLIPPEDGIDKPTVKLIDFAKSWLLHSGETEVLHFSVPLSQLAVFDEDKAAWITERGRYRITASKNVRDLSECFVYNCEKTKVIKQCKHNLMPHLPFKRICRKNGQQAYDDALLKTYNIEDRIAGSLPASMNITGDKGYKFSDVCRGNVSVREFVAQLSVDDLTALIHGEGMNSQKVRAGTGAAFGGMTEGLKKYGIPIAAATDGPSGLRLDNGDKATAIPIGTALASTWNKQLVEDLYTCVGGEMLPANIDLLLGPGLNIHRDPLCGRNFEYYSEDPLISGVMAAAAINGLQRAGVDGTLKHFAVNNQEENRKRVASIVSERAMREIYLKGLEYALEMSDVHALMTSYNPLNGHWCASNYELIHEVIREEFGFRGMIMTDWWADMDGESDSAPSKTNKAGMIRAGGDIYMVVRDIESIEGENNIKQALDNNALTLGELQEAAINIIELLIRLRKK